MAEARRCIGSSTDLSPGAETSVGQTGPPQGVASADTSAGQTGAGTADVTMRELSQEDDDAPIIDTISDEGPEPIDGDADCIDLRRGLSSAGLAPVTVSRPRIEDDLGRSEVKFLLAGTPAGRGSSALTRYVRGGCKASCTSEKQ